MRRMNNAVLSKLPTSPAEILALDLDAVKLQRRVGSGTALDDLFTTWILAAASHFEEQTGRQVMQSDFELRLDGFPHCDRYLELPKPPLVSVASIAYSVDGSPDTAIFDPSNYVVRAPVGDHCAPGRIELRSGCTWPTHTHVPGAIVVTFTGGYAQTPDDVPRLIRTALMYLVGTFHKYGEEVVGGPEANLIQKVPLGASTLMDAFKYSALNTQAPWEVPWLV